MDTFTEARRFPRVNASQPQFGAAIIRTSPTIEASVFTIRNNFNSLDCSLILSDSARGNYLADDKCGVSIVGCQISLFQGRATFLRRI